jgi:hypothetical protein
LEKQVSFLTLNKRKIYLLISAISMIYSPNIFSQVESKSSDALQFSTRAIEPQSSLFASKLSNPILATLVALIFIGLILVIVWPNESQSNIYQRQRKYARIDGLFLRVSGYVLSQVESKQFLKESAESTPRSFVSARSPDSLYVVSLSCGGLSLETPYKIEKGQILRVNLHELPDFPTHHLCVYAKVVWSKVETKDNQNEVWLCGAKFMLMNSEDNMLSVPPDVKKKIGSHESQIEESEILRKYINYMMDDLSV